MKIDIVTLFPGMFPEALGASIIGRACQRGVVEIGYVNPRDFSRDKHRKVDERPYGGGTGMVLTAEPLAAAIKSVAKRGSRVVYLSPQGRRFDSRAAQGLAKFSHLVLVCGHYEGVDERVMSLFDEELSIGDYVLTGGELPAMVVVDAVARFVPGVLAKDAVTRESFEGGLLDYPQYTRPRAWRGKKVPRVLFSGDHGRIEAWRSRAAKLATKKKRPDLLGIS